MSLENDKHNHEDCVFCQIENDPKKLTTKKIAESELAFCILDKYPVTKGHALIIPKNHYKDWESTPNEVLSDMVALSKKIVSILRSEHPDIKGFNYTSNQGSAAKQVIFHLHLHIIPRY